jgi:regulation of enolase protein 1 (concanavalin A-like superfamily)
MEEGFDGPALDPRLRWWNPPLRAALEGSRLVVASAAGTDFWQRTHYGFRADNGHFLFAQWAGDLVLSTTVRACPVHQYDQAGLMVRLSPDCWLKTSIEFEPDRPSRLGAVVTNHGWSDWSTQDVPQGLDAIALRVRREGADYLIEHALPDHAADPRAWSQLRVAHLAEDDGSGPVRCGLYACSPQGAGFVAEFEQLSIRSGRPG